jgi:hypothetical protein
MPLPPPLLPPKNVLSERTRERNARLIGGLQAKRVEQRERYLNRTKPHLLLPRQYEGFGAANSRPAWYVVDALSRTSANQEGEE